MRGVLSSPAENRSVPLGVAPPSWQRVAGAASGTTVDRYDGASFSIGHFRCPATASAWRHENEIGAQHLIVVPGRAVEIAQAGRAPLVASRVTAVFYNAHQAYRRVLLDPWGDDCVYFALDRPTLLELVRDTVAYAVDDAAPFAFAHGPIEGRDYADHLALLKALRAGEACDALGERERVLHLLGRLVSRAACASGRRVHAVPTDARAVARRRLLARAVECLLSRRYAEDLSLEDIADEVGASPYHTARVFHEQTGRTIHQYRTAVRLHAGIDGLLDRRVTLSELALELGFSSHAHFSVQFRQCFGETPSQFRARLLSTGAIDRADRASRILKARAYPSPLRSGS